jgi:hypothetical protein
MFAINLGALPVGKLMVEVQYVTDIWRTNQRHRELDTSTSVDVPWHVGFVS